MRPEELREKTDPELHDLLQEKREAYSNLKFKRVTDVIEDSSQFTKIQKDIARILTILNERQQDSESTEYEEPEPATS